MDKIADVGNLLILMSDLVMVHFLSLDAVYNDTELSKKVPIANLSGLGEEGSRTMKRRS